MIMIVRVFSPGGAFLYKSTLCYACAMRSSRTDLNGHDA